MEDDISASTLMDSTASKIQQLQKAFAELESHRAITLNVKWKQLEEHFQGLQKSLKRRFTELEEQEKNFQAKVVESSEILEERKACVLAKEKTSLEMLQEKRDAAVSAILNASEKQDQVLEASLPEKKVQAPMVAESNYDDMKKTVVNMVIQVKKYPELVTLCKEMSSEGLLKFISDNRKDLLTLKEEIPIALRAAANPASLVLDCLKGFYGISTSNSDSKKDANLLGIRRTCIMLMECLSSLFMDLDINSLSDYISENVKERAKAIAEEWKPKLDYLDADASNGNSLEAHAFLQLLATFYINSDFDQEILSKLIPMVSRRRQTAQLCRYLGLSDKIPGVIDILVRTGRQIGAVNLAFAFDLTNQFSPIPLLKSYLSEAKKMSSAPKSGQVSSDSSIQSDVDGKELSALKAVIKCIEDHKLEQQFPVEPLQKQIIEIEKMKKRGTEVAKPQPKRPRANAMGHQAGPPQRVIKPATEKNFYHGRMVTSDRYQQPHYIYDNHRPYAAYHVPGQAPFLGTPAYSFSPSHGSFFANAAYQYQTAYLH